MKELDLFGNEIITHSKLEDQFGCVPVSVFNLNKGWYTRKQKKWNKLGIKSELGRENLIVYSDNMNKLSKGVISKSTVSIFPPTICELMYNWFCVPNGTILDPFAGGSVRGIIAHYLGYKYTGIDIRQEQIDSNKVQGMEILDLDNQPNWYAGDSNEVLNKITKEFDFIFSCPPYVDLEVYSDLEGDISNMKYKDFIEAYESIISKSCNLLKVGGYACFVVGEVRDKKGNYIGFVPDTINAFKKCGMDYYNEVILYGRIASKSMVAGSIFKKSKKITKVHQNILVFKKNNLNRANAQV